MKGSLCDHDDDCGVMWFSKSNDECDILMMMIMTVCIYVALKCKQQEEVLWERISFVKMHWLGFLFELQRFLQ